MQNNTENKMNYRRLKTSLLAVTFATAAFSSAAHAMTVPVAPSGLTATYSNGYINLSWKDNAYNETEQHIGYSTNNGTYNFLAKVGANVTHYSYKPSAGASGTCYFKIRSYNSAGGSTPSAPASVTISTTSTSTGTGTGTSSGSSTGTSTATSSVFQRAWTTDFLKPVSSGATFTSFKASSDSSPGFHAGYIFADVNYEVLSSNSNPIVNILLPGSWTNRASGTTLLGRTNLPTSFVVPDATSSDMPNNPTIIYNSSTSAATYLNGMARPSAGGPIWGYIGSRPSTHGGSGLAGGELTLAELNNNNVNHALAIDVWGQKYLSSSNGGFVYPAYKADDGYNSPSSGNYYGGSISNLKMGSRLAIPAGVTADQLGITSSQGRALFKAMQTYGAIVVDNSAWDCLYINATPDTQNTIAAIKPDIAKLFAALKIVQ